MKQTMTTRHIRQAVELNLEADADRLADRLAEAMIRMADSRVASGGTVTAAEIDDLAANVWQRMQDVIGNALLQHRSAGTIAIRAALSSRDEAARRAAPKPKIRTVEFVREGGRLRATVVEMPGGRAGR